MTNQFVNEYSIINHRLPVDVVVHHRLIKTGYFIIVSKIIIFVTIIVIVIIIIVIITILL